jgi:hypothetical protein
MQDEIVYMDESEPIEKLVVTSKGVLTNEPIIEQIKPVRKSGILEYIKSIIAKIKNYGLWKR